METAVEIMGKSLGGSKRYKTRDFRTIGHSAQMTAMMEPLLSGGFRGHST